LHRLECLRVKQYVNISIATDEADAEMIYPTHGSNPGNIPEAMMGLWWMDGNPLAENVASFGGGRALSATDVYQSTLGNRNWMFDDTPGGLKLLQATRFNLTGIFSFNADYTEGTIHTRLSGIRIPTALLEFPMVRIDADTWRRPSILLRGLYTQEYMLRRIVDPAGQRIEPTWSDFLANSPPRSLLNAINPEWIALGC
jgi:hypothetical protein